MKAIERFAKEYAENWTKPKLPEAEIAALEGAYLSGFRKARDMAAHMVESFHNPRIQQLGVVIRFIAEAREEDMDLP